VFVHSLNNKSLVFLAMSFLILFTGSVIAQDAIIKPQIGIAIVSDYSKTNNPIQVMDKTFTFQTGSIGVRATMDFDKYGDFYLQYGLGRSPSEKATFANAEVSGSIDIGSWSYGYVYPYDIVDTPWSVDFKINKTTNKHAGDSLTGSRYDKPVTASVDASSSFTRGSVGLNYHAKKDVVLTAGIGIYNWDISAKAKGLFVNSPGIRFSTDTEASGKDQFHYIEARLPISGRTMNFGIRQSNLTADNKNTLREVYAGVAFAWSY